ncbi:MAG: hypothetical protein AMJ79_13830 [Phycisphaerae bacterium SM23_30]|nr:MAG: hypothetical protein AMJ79_13830 [Phycisphaerae bacterium SM23_30]
MKFYVSFSSGNYKLDNTMQEDRQNQDFLPEGVTGYIASVIRKVRYRRKVRREVQQELTDHFTDALADCESESEKQQRAEQMIADFGDAKLLARLIRRGKKRCRPLWKKVLIHTGQTVLAAYIISCLCNAWFIHTWAAYGDTDYTQRFNQLSRPETPQTENAALYYEKAAELFVKPQKNIEEIILGTCSGGVCALTLQTDAELSQEQKAALEKWFAANEPAWQQVVAATEIPYCWGEVDEISSENIKKVLLRIESCRTFARLGIARARQEAGQNQFDQAAAQCYTILRMGKHFSGPKLLIEHLVGLACIKQAESYLLTMLGNIDPESLPLDQMQNQLQTIFSDGYPVLNSKVEMNWNLGMTQNMFSHYGTVGVIGYFYPGMFIFMGNRERLETDTLLFHKNLANVNPYQYQLIPKDDDQTRTGPELAMELVKKSLWRTLNISYRGKALHEALVTIIALQRCKLDKGAYPENMQELIAAGFLRRLPDDPYSDGILKYQRQGEDFILYSVGADFDDDGGTENPEDPWGEGDAGGDRVFWPIK